MKERVFTYGIPNIGCLIGTAYQTLTVSLAASLSQIGLDITSSEYLLLRCLYDNDGMRLCDIGEKLGKDKGAISRCVSSLVNKGYITTETISHKRVLACLTERGRKIKSEIMTVAQERHKALSDLLTKDEMEILDKVLKKIIDNRYNKKKGLIR